MKLLGRGETGSVYNIGKGKVVKLFHEDKLVNEEYSSCKYIGQYTPFAPTVYKKVIFKGKVGYEMELVEGELLSDCLTDKNYEQLAYLMGIAHREVHEFDTLYLELPNIQIVMSQHIKSLESVSEQHKVWLLQLLKDLPHGAALLHGDFMPYNMMYSKDTLKALDWSDAMLGPSEADIARTLYFILDPMTYENAIFTKKSNKFIEAYLNGYYNNSVSRSMIEKWLLLNVVFEYDLMQSKGIFNEFSERLKSYIENNFVKMGSDSLF